MPIPSDALLLVALVIFAGYLVFGVTGFGASPITIPVLVHVLPLVFVLPLAAILDLGSGLALGLFVCGYAMYVMLRRETARRLTRWWAAPAGIVGGVVGALFGMGGPPYVAYIAGRVPDPAAQRATISQMVILNVGLRVLAFALAGLLASRALWVAVALLLPVAWLGVWVGHRVHVRLASAAAARIVGAVLFLTGAALIARSF